MHFCTCATNSYFISKKYHCILLATLSLLISQPLLSQNDINFRRIQQNDYAKFINYYDRDGVCSYEFTDIIQDQYGLIWIATQKGLMRFDGAIFKPYQGSPTPGKLPHSHVTSLAKDKGGTLWIATKAGLCTYNPKSDRFIPIDTLFGKPIPGNKSILKIYFDKKDRLWVYHFGGMLNCINFASQKIENLQLRFSSNEFYPFHAITDWKNGILIGGATLSTTHVSTHPIRNALLFQKDTIINGKAVITWAISDFYDDGSDFLWVANYAGYGYRINRVNSETSPLLRPSIYTFCSYGDGRLWLGGYHFGAMLFNTYDHSAIRFTNNESNPESLAGNLILKIFRDNQDNTWFLTSNGISVLSAKQLYSTHIRTLADVNGLSTNRITAALPEYPKGIWLGTQSKGLIYFDMANKSFTRHGFNVHPDSISSNWVTAIAKTNDGSLLLTLWNAHHGALNRFWPSHKRFQRYNTNNYYWFSNVAALPDNKAWVAPWGLPLLEFDAKQNRFTGCAVAPIEKREFISSNDLNSIIASGNGWIIFSKSSSFNIIDHDTLILMPRSLSHLNLSINPDHIIYLSMENLIDEKFFMGYLFVLDEKGRVSQLDLKKRRQTRIRQGNVEFNNIYADRHLYAISKNSIYRYNLATAKFELLLVADTLTDIKHIADETNGLLLGTDNGLFRITNLSVKPKIEKVSDGIVTAVSKMRGRTYVATNQGVLVLENESIKDRCFEGTHISGFSIDSSGHAWVATYTDLYRVNLQNYNTKKVYPDPKNQDALPSTQIKVLTTDALGNVWFLSNSCVSRYNASKKKFENYYEPSGHSLFSTLLHRIYPDTKGNLWVGYTVDGVGVDCFNPATRIVTHYPHLPYDSLSYPKTTFTHCIFEDADGKMLFGTDQGLAILHPGQKQFLLIGKDAGLPSPAVTAVNQDRFGNYWVGTANGVARYSKKLKRVDRTSADLGLQEGKITAIERWGFDSLIICGDNGINLINPYVTGNEIPLQNVKITTCTSDNDTLVNFPDSQSKVKLRAYHKRFEVHFSSTDFTSPGKLTYHYWLEGFEDSLKANTTSSSFVRYSNLPQGRYTFKIYYSRLNDGAKSNVSSLAVWVAPPIYLKDWFILLILAFTALMVWLFETFKINRIKRKKKELEDAVLEKTREILSHNEELKAQTELIKRQGEEIRLKSFQLCESLEFARSLQFSLMPDEELMASVLGEHFIIYRPKDVVSGDFYWVRGSADEFVVVVADATGHGVHGGFVSMMGLTLLNDVFNRLNLCNPAELIVGVHEHLIETIGSKITFKPDTTVGIDLSVCFVNRKTRLASFASTHNPLYHLGVWGDNSCELRIHKSGGRALGSRWFTPNIPVVQFDIEPGELLLLSTDGLFDQVSFANKKRYGRKAFEELLADKCKMAPHSICKEIEAHLETWQGNAPQTDDITLLGFMV